MGQREDLTAPEKMALFVKKFKEAGATILGGCCETRPLILKKWLNLSSFFIVLLFLQNKDQLKLLAMKL